MKRSILILVVSAIAIASLSGCPLYPVAPLNTTGVFTGSWSALIPALGEDPVSCTVTLTLKQETLLSVYPLNHTITGRITFDFSCGIVQVLVLLLKLPQTISYDIVLGTMAEDGTFSLVGTDNEDNFNSGLVLEAIPTDADGDKQVDSLEGTWFFTVPTGSIPVMVQGEFTAAKGSA